MENNGQPKDPRRQGAGRGGDRGGPHGPGRGGPHGPHDRRGGHDRPATGRAGAEHAILAILHELERPLTGGDFEVQKGHFAKILDKLKPLKLKAIDDLDFDCRTRLFTSLLRAGRQPAATDEAKEAVRKDLMFVLGEIWSAVNDDGRAGKLYAESGRSEPAIRLLQASGAWAEAAALHRKDGRPLEAAKLYEKHDDWAGAAEAYREANDARSWLRAALRAGNPDEVRKAARALGPKAAKDALFRARQGDVYLELLAQAGDWGEIAQLYERAEQWADAAQVFEKMKRLARAAECWSKAGDLVAAARCLDREVQERLARNDRVGAGEVLRHAGQVERAVELVQEAKPELGFKWLQKAGLDARALEFAKARAKEREARPADAAIWLERAGELPLAAQAFAEGNRPAEASRVWESIGDWERAGEAAARAGQTDRALDLLRRAGAGDAEERVQRLAPPPPPPEAAATSEAPAEPEATSEPEPAGS